MQDVKEAYNSWAEQYDTNKNRTRDLEARSLRETLAGLAFDRCLEIGCGTGKNTEWLVTKAQHVTAADLSEEMLARAKEKVPSEKAEFVQADILQPWTFAKPPYNLVTFSLVLEHIEDLTAIFKKAENMLAPGGYLYVGELHPFKQYSGTKARYNTDAGVQEVTCFTHHISDFVQAAQQHGLQLVLLNEYFDEDDRTTTPRILTLLFRKA